MLWLFPAGIMPFHPPFSLSEDRGSQNSHRPQLEGHILVPVSHHCSLWLGAVYYLQQSFLGDGYKACPCFTVLTSFIFVVPMAELCSVNVSLCIHKPLEN